MSNPTQAEIQELIAWVDREIAYAHDQFAQADPALEAIRGVLQQHRTEPCEECEAWVNRNADMRILYSHYTQAHEILIYKYCPNCSRPLKGASHE